MIKILMIGMTDNLGGIENFIINYYRNIDKNKFKIDFINIYDNDLCFQDELLSYDSKVFKIANYYKHPIKYMKELYKIIKENQYDVVHCNMNSAVMLYPIIVAKKAKVKTIISHSHNSSSDKGIIKSILHGINKHFIPLFANTFVACSNRAGAWFFSKKILKSKDYYVIKNAINTDKFQYNENSRNKKRNELGISKDTIVIGHVGRFNKQKNHTYLVDIFNKYHNDIKDSILLLIGQGPLENEIKQKVNDLGLNDSVMFLGQRNDVNDLYQAMDIFILPSLYEGLPLVGVEAQVSGLSCLFSDRITKEVALSDKCLFIPLNNDSEWTNNIKKNNKRKEDSLKYKNYDINNCVKDLEKIYIKSGEKI